ncbi:TPA: transcriptional repressor [Klebsiella pneumoniae]|nr:transcriptional repressor [Klebsiella pneumoniae]HDY9362081.1 transcriptional repressor [Klebsiella pneumoniae]
MRATPSTLATLQCLEHASQAMSHDDLTQQLGEQAPDRVTLYRILERLMQVSIVQRYTDSARTQRFALTQRAAVGLFECDNCHHVIPIEQDPALEAAIELVKSHLTGHGMTEREITLSSHGICPDCNRTVTK